MLPLLPLRAPFPTAASLPKDTVSVGVTFRAPSSAELKVSTALDTKDPRVSRVLDWAVNWVRAAFTTQGGLAWKMSHAQFTDAIRKLVCAKLNTAGTFEEATPWILQTYHQSLNDTDGSQDVNFVFAVDLTRIST